MEVEPAVWVETAAEEYLGCLTGRGRKRIFGQMFAFPALAKWKETLHPKGLIRKHESILSGRKFH